MNPKRNRARDIGFYVLLLLIMVAVIFTMTKETEPDQLENYSELVDLFTKEKVQSFTTEGNKIHLVIRTGDSASPTEEKNYDLYSFNVFYSDFNELILDQHNRGVLESYDYNEGFVVPWWASIIPYLILMGGAMVLWYVMMNRMGGGAGGVARFSKARTRLGSDEKNKKTFADVAGCDEEKEELAEIVEFLKDPKAYTAMGARIPKGVLLVGPPGTGKTLLAKAVAGEAGVQFLSISGSDFVELYVGVGVGRVRDLFEQAKKHAPAIIFIDEIDAVGRHRGAGLGGGHDEREQTLNQLLVEMDGFTGNESVIVIAATNRRDILDPALLRPGRFDRQIVVGYPDVKGREEILKVHAANKSIGPDVDLKIIAQTTQGFTGADLENLLNEAALLAARNNRKAIIESDIEEATMKVIAGPEKKSRIVTERDKKVTAYHEAGHAIAAYNLPTQDKVHQVTIIQRGMAAGLTVTRPDNDDQHVSRNQMRESIIMLLGGRVAEELILDDICTGASNDIERATKTARNMVTKYGFSKKLGTVVYGSDNDEVFLGKDYGHTRNYSETIAAQIDEEVKAIIEKAYEDCKSILTANTDKLHLLAKYLLKFEKISGEDFEKLMKGQIGEEVLTQEEPKTEAPKEESEAPDASSSEDGIIE